MTVDGDIQPVQVIQIGTKGGLLGINLQLQIITTIHVIQTIFMGQSRFVMRISTPQITGIIHIIQMTEWNWFKRKDRMFMMIIRLVIGV